MIVDANALYHAPAAIDTLLAAELISVRTATRMRAELERKISAAMEYYGDKGYGDVVDGLNRAWRRIETARGTPARAGL